MSAVSRRGRRGAPAARPARRQAPAVTPHGEPAGPAARVSARWAVAVAAAVAVVLLAIALGPHRIGDYFTETDFYGAYAEGARLLQHGRLEPSRYGVVGPGYDAALALVGFVVRDLFLAGELISIAASVCTLLLWHAILRRRAGEPAALIAALLLAANPYFIRYGYSATTDAFAIALQAGALALLLLGTRARVAAAAGAIAALASLTRYNAVYLLPAGLVALLAGGTPQAARGRAALAFAAGFLAPFGPWMGIAFAHGAGGAFQLHHNLAYEVYARSRGIAWDEYQRTLQPQFHNLWDVIARDPGAVLRRVALNGFEHLKLDARILLGWPLAVAAALGALIGFAEPAVRRLWPLWAAGGLLFLTLVPVFHSERYSLALLPFYTALAGLFFGSPRFALVIGRARRVALKPLLALVPLALSAVAAARLQARTIDQLPVEVLECARVLRQLERPGDRLIARKPHLAFHAGVEGVPFPFTRTLPELADYARKERARWLFMSWPEAELRPYYWYLLDTTATVPGLTARCVTRPHPAVLYEIGPEFGRVPAWYQNDTLRLMHVARARLIVAPDEVPALASLGGALRALGRLDSARILFQHAARLSPREPRFALALGDIALSKGDLGGADQAFARAQALDPGSVDAAVGRGWASLLARRPEEAAQRWRPVISSTRDPATLERMVELFHALGDREAEAAARARRAAGRRP